jgi:hypothetical protein
MQAHWQIVAHHQPTPQSCCFFNPATQRYYLLSSPADPPIRCSSLTAPGRELSVLSKRAGIWVCSPPRSNSTSLFCCRRSARHCVRTETMSAIRQRVTQLSRQARAARPTGVLRDTRSYASSHGHNHHEHAHNVAEPLGVRPRVPLEARCRCGGMLEERGTNKTGSLRSTSLSARLPPLSSSTRSRAPVRTASPQPSTSGLRRYQTTATSGRRKTTS